MRIEKRRKFRLKNIRRLFCCCQSPTLDETDSAEDVKPAQQPIGFEVLSPNGSCADLKSEAGTVASVSPSSSRNSKHSLSSGSAGSSASPGSSESSYDTAAPQPVYPGQPFARANFHQGNENIFNWAGSQCTSMAATAIALGAVIPHSEWNSGVLDHLMLSADSFHGTQLARLGRKCEAQHRVGLFEMENKTRIMVADQYVSLTQRDAYHGVINPTADVDLASFGAHTLLAALENATEAPASGIVLTVGDYSTSIMRIEIPDEFDEYLLFDSHCRNAHGFPSEDGTAVVVKFDTLSEVAEHVEIIAHGVDIEYNLISFDAQLEPATTDDDAYLIQCNDENIVFSPCVAPALYQQITEDDDSSDYGSCLAVCVVGEKPADMAPLDVGEKPDDRSEFSLCCSFYDDTTSPGMPAVNN